MAIDYLDRLSQFVVETRLDDLAESTVVAAKAVVLDTIGAILAGSRLPENASLASLAQEMSGSGESTVLGTDRKVQPALAALVNGTAGVALEVDEGNRLGGGHASIHVMPAAMGVAEGQGASGKAFLESVIVGYEVTSRIGSATQSKPEIHSHGTWGTIGAAAATARLLGFDAAETRQAMSMAVSMSPANTWTPCLEGATVRNLYPGRSGFQGVLAAQLVRCGFTGIRDAPQDLYTTIIGDGFDPDAVVDGLGQPGSYRIQNNYFKFHACCLYNHPALDAVHAIAIQENLSPADVKRVRVEAAPIAMMMAGDKPGNMLAAKFSVPHAVAVSLVHGVTDVTAFYPDKLEDPAVRDLAQKVELAADPQMSPRRFDYPAARVTMWLADGRQVSQSVFAHHGDSQNPAPREELVSKFSGLVLDSLGDGGTREVLEAADCVDSLGSIRELTKLLGKIPLSPPLLKRD